MYSSVFVVLEVRLISYQQMLSNTEPNAQFIFCAGGLLVPLNMLL